MNNIVEFEPRRAQAAARDQKAAEADAPAVVFNAVLHPNRSLSPRGFLILMGVLCSISFSVGFFFVKIGAWPIPGFMGLDVLLVYWAFRKNYIDGRVTEWVKVDTARVVVERREVSGKKRLWAFNPYWARVVISDAATPKVSVRLESHGRKITLGGFLSPQERRDFGAALDAALHRARAYTPAVNRPTV